MSQLIVYANNPDGTGVSFMTLANGLQGKALQDLLDETSKTKYGVRVIEEYELPSIPSIFMGSLKMNVELKVVGVDLEVAKEIWRDEWRAARAPLLAKLDIDYMRALETNDTVWIAEIVNKKQQLRDVTDTPINAFSAQDVMNVWPEILNG